MSKVGELCKSARLRKGLTQGQLCEIIGEPQSAYSNFERGAGQTLHRTVLVARVLGIDANDIFEAALS